MEVTGVRLNHFCFSWFFTFVHTIDTCIGTFPVQDEDEPSCVWNWFFCLLPMPEVSKEVRLYELVIGAKIEISLLTYR